MVALASHFVALLSLCALVAVPAVDARAISRTHDAPSHSHSKHPDAQPTQQHHHKADSDEQPPVVPLPKPANRATQPEKDDKKHVVSGYKKVSRAFGRTLLARILGEDEPALVRRAVVPRPRAPSKGRRVPSRIMGRQFMGMDSNQAAFLLKRSDDGLDILDPLVQLGPVKLGDGRNGDFSDKHHLLGARDPDPHHHHHHKGSTVVVTREPHSPDVVVVDGHHHHNPSVVIDRHHHVTVVSSREVHTQQRLGVVDSFSKDVPASMAGVPGTVDIISTDDSPMKIASLVLSNVGTNSTNGTNSTSPMTTPFVLDASNSTQSQVFLVASPQEMLSDSNSTMNATDPATPPGIKVTLQMAVFDQAQAAMVPYCATFDPNPPAPSPLGMEECMDGEDDADEHKSQTFIYEPDSGNVRPMWALSSVNNTDSSNSTQTGASADMISGDPTASNTTSPDASPMPLSVKMVFTPAEPVVHAVQNSSRVATFEPSANSTSTTSSEPYNATPDFVPSETSTSTTMATATATTTTTMTSDGSAATPSNGSGTSTSASAEPTVTGAEADELMFQA